MKFYNIIDIYKVEKSRIKKIIECQNRIIKSNKDILPVIYKLFEKYIIINVNQIS
jgi:hypothetical protein